MLRSHATPQPRAPSILRAALCAAATLAACGTPAGQEGAADMGAAPADFGDPLSWPLDKPGPYSVGYRELRASYTPAGAPGVRTIKVAFWYPSTSRSGVSPTYGILRPDEQAFTDAPPAAPAWPGGYPVLVHSHSYPGFAGSNGHYVRYLVSHGWAVIEPEHLGNTLFDTPKKAPLLLYLHRPLDVRAALDLAASLPAGDSLAGKLDLTRVAMSGHSYGTYTAALVAGTRLDVGLLRADCAKGEPTDCAEATLAALGGDLSEPRARLIIAMGSPLNGYFGTNEYDPRRLPVLSMFGTLNPGGQLALQARTTGVDYTVLEVRGGCHELFNLGNNFVGDLGNNSGIPCSQLPDEEGYALVSTYELAYLRKQLLGDTSAATAAIVDGSQSVSERVTVHVKPAK